MPPAGFEPTISAGDWTQTHVLDRAATGTGVLAHLMFIIIPTYAQISSVNLY